MEYLKNAIETLQDPYLVARFQRYFGIRETSYPEAPKFYQRNGRSYDRDLSPVGHGHETTDVDPRKFDEKKLSVANKTYVGPRNLDEKKLPGTDTKHFVDSGSRLRSTPQSQGLSQGSDDETSGSDSAGSQTKSKIKALLFQSMTAEGEYADSDGEARDFIATKPFWHALFVFGSALGDELFYATFFPLWFWNIDGAVGRRAVLVWFGIMYIGQAMKDVLKIPRPACPPVIRVQKKWALEYGFPSTHSMIGIAMPAALSIFTIERYQYPVILAVIPALFWCLSVCGSRLYLGMHSVLDVLAGLLFGVLVLCGLILPYIDAVDEYLVTNSYSPIALSVFIALSVLLYPAGNTWTPARGDTVIICAVVLGIYSGAWMNYSKHLISAASSAPPYAIIWPTYEMWGQVLARSSIGLSSVLATRAIFRSLSYATVCALLRLNQQDVTLRRANVTQRQFVIVELSYKFMTYAAVGFDIIYTAPLVFRLIGIERPEFYTEV